MVRNIHSWEQFGHFSSILGTSIPLGSSQKPGAVGGGTAERNEGSQEWDFGDRMRGCVSRLLGCRSGGPPGAPGAPGWRVVATSYFEWWFWWDLCSVGLFLQPENLWGLSSGRVLQVFHKLWAPTGSD